MNKKFLGVIAIMLSGVLSLPAQTPEEIVRKMSEQMDRADTEGFTMDFRIKIALLGEISSHNMVRGDKMRSDVMGKERQVIMWADAQTTWEYNSQTNEITISARENAPAPEGSDLSRFDAIKEGYRLKLQKETDEAWYISCKKSKTNKAKDDPKNMELVVAKGSYLPILMKVKQSAVTVCIENVTLGVSEASVTFDPLQFPEATIVDKRLSN